LKSFMSELEEHQSLIARLSNSISGKSKNILKAVEAAKSKGMIVIGLTGCEGGELSKQATVSVIVPSLVTARIQEAHILIGHWWCGAIEEVLSVSNNA
jgi:D-sedoheptulose 7-phosphate isomerase